MFVPGLCHHISHRGNNRTTVFADSDDRTIFLVLFGRAMRRGRIAVHSYALMGNHYHAVVTAPDEEALPRAMQRLGRGYVRYFNDRHRRTGTLWEGRYHASLLVDERYWFNAMRYVEMNPVAANMVRTPDEHPWSSYHHNALGSDDALLTPHPLYQGLASTPAGRQIQWRALCDQPLTSEELALIDAALRSNRPLHRPGFAETAATCVEPELYLPPT